MRFKNQTNESFSDYFNRFMQKVKGEKKTHDTTPNGSTAEEAKKPDDERSKRQNEEFIKAMFNADEKRVNDFILMGFNVNQRIHEHTPLTKACTFFKV